VWFDAGGLQCGPPGPFILMEEICHEKDLCPNGSRLCPRRMRGMHGNEACESRLGESC